MERLKVIVNNTDNKKPSSCWDGRISAKIPFQMGAVGVVSRYVDLEGLATQFMVMKFDTNKLEWILDRLPMIPTKFCDSS